MLFSPRSFARLAQMAMTVWLVVASTPKNLGALIVATLLCAAPTWAQAQATDYTTVSASSSSALAGWPLSHLYDGRTDTVWSSNGYATPDNREWLTITLDQKRNVNYLNFATRFSDGNAFGFPLSFTVYFLDTTGWKKSISIVNYARPKSLWTKVTLPETVYSNMFWVDVQLLGDDQLGDGGRYFQLAEARAGYNPTQTTEYIPSTSAASSALWPVANLHDDAAWSVWSTEVRATANGGDWVAFWWPQGVQTINSVRFLPRNVNGKALGFPTSFTLHWADHSGGTAVWRSIVSSTARPDGLGWLTVALPHSVRTDGVVMAANTLGTDDYGSYVFQLAEARGTYNPALAQSSPYEQFDVNHILSTGQSLSIGARGEPVAPDRTSYSWYDNWMFAGGVTRPNDLSAFAHLREDGVETMSTALADHVSWRRSTELPLFRTDRPTHQLLISGNGIGGRNYSQLAKLQPGVSCPSGSNGSGEELHSCAYPNSLQQVQAAHDLAGSLGQTHAVRAVTVVHGESDHNQGNTSYASNLATWQQNYEDDIKLITGQRGTIPLLQSQLSSWTDYGDAQSSIPQAQIEAHRARRGLVILVGPKYNLKYAADGVHLTAAGYRHMGEYYAKVYRRVVLEGGVWEPVRPRSITRSGAVITIRFYVPVPPLVFDTSAVSNPQNYGFQVVEGSNVAVPIASVQMNGPDAVTITLTRVPTGTPRVRYAFTGIPGNAAGPTTGPRGNLRDSDTTPSRYGNKLYNWSVHFEHSIPFSDR